ncbi:MAG: tetratricopeptide repeat protein [Candidatus Cybelea sp.]
MRAPIAFALLLAVTALPALAQSTLPPELQRALAPTDAGAGLDRALATASDYIVANPKDGNGYATRCALRQVIVQRRGGNLSEARSDCQTGVALAPQSAFAHFVYGDLLYDSDRFADSLAQYTQAIDLGENDRGIYWKRCDAYRRLGRLDEAMSDCNKQIALTPEMPVAYYARGHLQVERQDYTDAVADLTIALQDPQMPFPIDALYWRGQAYAALGKLALADADYSLAIAKGDKSPDTYFARAQVRRNLGNGAAALADLQAALQIYRAAGMNDRAQAVLALIAAINAPPPKTPVVTSVQVDGITFSAGDILRLFAGLRAALDPNDKSVHLLVTSASAAEMPSYDPQWHYGGVQMRPDGTPAIALVIAQGIAQASIQRAIEAGVLLGLADSGYCGPKWKALYDQAAAADAKLGANAPDPFVNRRALALQLAQAYEAALKSAQ